MREDDVFEFIRSTLEEAIENMRRESTGYHISELGIIEEVYPHATNDDNNNYECDVRLRDRDIVLKKVPVATQQIGLANIPNKRDLVLLTFVNGNINSPVIIGRLYNNHDRPPISKEEEVVYVPPYLKNQDHRRVYLELPGESLKITISEKGIDIYTESDIHVHSKGRTIVTSDNDLALKAKDITIESETSLTLKAPSGDLVISGKMVRIN